MIHCNSTYEASDLTVTFFDLTVDTVYEIYSTGTMGENEQGELEITETHGIIKSTPNTRLLVKINCEDDIIDVIIRPSNLRLGSPHILTAIIWRDFLMTSCTSDFDPFVTDTEESDADSVSDGESHTAETRHVLIEGTIKNIEYQYRPL